MHFEPVYILSNALEGHAGLSNPTSIRTTTKHRTLNYEHELIADYIPNRNMFLGAKRANHGCRHGKTG
jgi:hypothetical protein